jgi:hypothetical protein
MSINSILTALQDLPFSAAIRGEAPGSEWTFAIVEILHVLALVVVFGSIALLDLRLLGWSSRGASITRLTRNIVPITWVAWLCAAITGSMLFVAKAVTYFALLEFQLKFLAMALAALNMLVFHFGAYRSVAQWDTALVPPAAARRAGVLSLALWIAVIFFGRWIGFTIH